MSQCLFFKFHRQTDRCTKLQCFQFVNVKTSISIEKKQAHKAWISNNSGGLSYLLFILKWSESGQRCYLEVPWIYLVQKHLPIKWGVNSKHFWNCCTKWRRTEELLLWPSPPGEARLPSSSPLSLMRRLHSLLQLHPDHNLASSVATEAEQRGERPMLGRLSIVPPKQHLRHLLYQEVIQVFHHNDCCKSSHHQQMMVGVKSSLWRGQQENLLLVWTWMAPLPLRITRMKPWPANHLPASLTATSKMIIVNTVKGALSYAKNTLAAGANLSQAKPHGIVWFVKDQNMHPMQWQLSTSSHFQQYYSILNVLWLDFAALITLIKIDNKNVQRSL